MNKKITYIILKLQFVLLFISCSDKIKLEPIINKFESINVQKYLGYCVYFRSRTNSDEKFYCVNRTQGKCAPYIVQVNSSNEIIGIDNEYVLKSCSENYLTSIEIEDVLEEYLKYEVSYIKIDSTGNLYVSLFNSSRPILLRVGQLELPKDFERYINKKDNWYILKGYEYLFE